MCVSCVFVRACVCVRTCVCVLWCVCVRAWVGACTYTCIMYVRIKYYVYTHALMLAGLLLYVCFVNKHGIGDDCRK